MGLFALCIFCSVIAGLLNLSSPQTTETSSTPGTARRTPPVNNSAPDAPMSFREVRAQDGSFSAKVPADWRVTSALLRYFQIDSPGGEKVIAAALDVTADAQSLQNYVALMQQHGIRVPQDELALMGRLVSRPLPPTDVVRVLFPRVGGGSVQNMSIVESQNLGTSQVSGALVHYKYTLAPGQVAMEGEALVFTLPPSYYGVYNYWTFIAFVGEGPTQLFQRNKALYVAILQTIKYDEQALRQNAAPPISNEWMSRQMRLPFDRMWENDPVYRETMTRRSNVLGGNATYQDPRSPDGGGTVPIGSLPWGSHKWWRCPGRYDPVVSDTWPGDGCYEIPAPR